MHNETDFLKNKIKEIHSALSSKDPSINELIGEVGDLFSSPYKRDVIADEETVQDLWDFLFSVFIESDDNNTKFDAISTMGDIYTYQSNIGFELCLKNIKQWRKSSLAEESSTELVDCIDDILSM
jgi:hypothetical protein